MKGPDYVDRGIRESDVSKPSKYLAVYYQGNSWKARQYTHKSLRSDKSYSYTPHDTKQEAVSIAEKMLNTQNFGAAYVFKKNGDLDTVLT